ncbi:hypothetical protein GW920_00685 [Candidatus Falkowbacteria bacterium]|uniref:Uncharacterized protein n=1 Tax=Candidatus Falkowbacteria bacterium CG10_big_fil_rev_8_21_14_0_10_37_18 TaxID=1974562 RepID=A0A2H0VBI9_9BACT|nr:hypothetical protein [Candidatus Falkowbacteria bacterium]NCQ13038.1 hypothetical protein [Candidatus Falkowbacteria bacterium]OIO05919.1 MAG: hypothetical protein AUJ26_02015 [Candidatus Falkowbacteria bacterium CG1_02_37_21]PIR95719.1 MAG: hypothetical protein COT93_01160 [Candidatus Falkowbacteria bacterium CG10_big_fil_rev_8_21_14_0_10_37_18]
MIDFFKQVLEITAIQIISLFGSFFIFGFVLSKIQASILNNYRRTVGWRGILWTAWLGTPVHEYGHAIFALLFRHKINEVVLFSPDATTGELGHVNHSYNKQSFYQSSGNFFIGLAPLILGPLFLVFLLYILVPQGPEIFRQLSGVQNSLAALTAGVGGSLRLLFSLENLKSFYFWIFLYISFCVASHLAPSKNDIKGAGRGWWVLVIYLFLFNILAHLFQWDFTEYIINFSHFFAGLFTVYVYVLIISLVHFLVSFLILLPWRKY